MEVRKFLPVWKVLMRPRTSWTGSSEIHVKRQQQFAILTSLDFTSFNFVFCGRFSHILSSCEQLLIHNMGEVTNWNSRNSRNLFEPSFSATAAGINTNEVRVYVGG
jgi:hypothetical protein